MAGPAAIGVDVGGTKLVAATVATDGGVLSRVRRDTPAHDQEQLVRTVVELLDELDADVPVGVGIAGLVTPGGVVRYGPNIGVEDLPLAERLSAVVRRPVTVVNDASGAALAEQRAGHAQGHDDVVMFTLGTGVGGGLVVGGQLMTGSGGLAGELGHVIVEEGGRACPCGNRGCVEAYSSGTALALTARERLVDRSVVSSLRDATALTGREVSDAALAGDAFARSILADAGRWLGIAAASIVNSLDPSIIVVGGGAAARTSRWLLPAAVEALGSRLVGARWRTAPPVELAALGDDAGMVGAALLALDRDQGLAPSVPHRPGADL